MNIGFFITSFENKGGIERLVVSLGDGLAKRGHRCTLFHPENISDPYPVPNDVQRIKLPAFKTDNLGIVAKEHLRASDFDVLCILCCDNGGRLFLSQCHGLNIPIVWSEHNAPFAIEQDYWNRPERLLCMASSDAVHLLCRDFLASIPRVLQKRVSIIPNCVDLKSIITAKTSCRTKRLLTVARLEESQKQLSFLISAFAKLKDKFSDWDCHICGEGPARGLYKELIFWHGLESRIVLTGNIEDIASEYAAADVFVFPSRYEGFGIALAEAQFFGIPGIGFAACNGVNEIIVHGETGLLAPEMTVESLTEQLRLLMSDEGLRQRMGARAQELSVRYHKEYVLDMWESMLQDAANKKAPLAMDRLDSLDDPEIKEALSSPHKKSYVNNKIFRTLRAQVKAKVL